MGSWAPFVMVTVLLRASGNINGSSSFVFVCWGC